MERSKRASGALSVRDGLGLPRRLDEGYAAVFCCRAERLNVCNRSFPAIVSRWAVNGANGVVSGHSVTHFRHPGLDPGSRFLTHSLASTSSGTPGQARGDEDVEGGSRSIPARTSPDKNCFPNISGDDLPSWMTASITLQSTPSTLRSRHRLKATKETFRTRTSVSFVALTPQAAFTRSVNWLRTAWFPRRR